MMVTTWDILKLTNLTKKIKEGKVHLLVMIGKKLRDYLELIYRELDKRVEDTITEVKTFLASLLNMYASDGSSPSQITTTRGSHKFPVSLETNCVLPMTQVKRKLAKKEKKRRANKAGIVRNDVDRSLRLFHLMYDVASWHLARRTSGMIVRPIVDLIVIIIRVLIWVIRWMGLERRALR
ncbi:unnamed protein product [Cuscuta campestris]|uniref:Uncharacterized protein n=1 Tax=Cuscuta campestris TaxID=132261 RepID=A0A484MFW4_9ASTE|nr:unnamed protein product [Cuscuta campestris]